MNNHMRIILTGLLVLCFASVGAFAKGPATAEVDLNKSNITTARTMQNIGNWGYWMYATGKSAVDPAGNSGGIFPRGTAGAIYEDGIIWGAYMYGAGDPELRVGGQTYRQGTQSGAYGSDPGAAENRLYKIRSDYTTLSHSQLLQEAKEVFILPSLASVTEGNTAELADQYVVDWEEWPVHLGAPFVDENDNGIMDGDEVPGIANADQVVWYVANDDNSALTTDLYGSPPMGIEMQVTAWGYNQRDAALGQLIFKKYLFINKSDFDMTDMYLSQWCDPDVGSHTNDFVGCDTSLSMMFAYNDQGTDAAYDPFDLAPPAAGYDFFQGPLVRTGNADDEAIWGLEKITGAVNLPMTSMGFFAAGSDISDPPLGTYEGTLQWYNMLRGFTPTNDVENPTPYIAGSGPDAGLPTQFTLSGDPVNDPDGLLGDVDGAGDNIGSSDRRMFMNSGPFTLAPGDSQELVVAVVGGTSGPLGSGSETQSVAVMKDNDIIAQQLYDDLFATVPKPPAPPIIHATPFEDHVILNWGSDAAGVAASEADNALTGYNFQGYNVYQLPSANAAKSEATLIATFDLIDGVTTITQPEFVIEYGTKVEIPVQFGLDKGVQRHFVADRDYINGTPLYPGNTYYFAVSAYNYNPAPALIEARSLESSLLVQAIVPQPPRPGFEYPDAAGSVLAADRVSGLSDGVMQVEVVDPTLMTGDSYRVFFAEFETYEPIIDDSTGQEIGTDTLVHLGWNIENTTTGEMIATDQYQAGNLDERNDQPIFDGVKVKVTGPVLDFKNFQAVTGSGGAELSEPVSAGTSWQGFPTPLDDDGFFTNPPSGVLGAGAWAIHTADNGTRGSYDSFVDRTTRGGDNWAEIIPYDYEMRFTAEGSWAWDPFNTGGYYQVPFELWNIGLGTPDDASDDFRMVPLTIDDDASGTYNMPIWGTRSFGSDEHSASSADNDPYTDWTYWYTATTSSDAEPPGDAGYQLAADSMAAGTYTAAHGHEVLARTVLMNWNGDIGDPLGQGVYSQDLPDEGSVFRIITNKPNSTADEWTFTTTAAGYSDDLAKAEAERINVFPNPYYADNPEEGTSRFTRFVTFNHLPANQEVTIRIFNLAGAQVNKLEKHNDATFNADQFFRWDLNNQAGLPVGSGIYIAHIDLPELGMTKVLKIFVVQPEEILEFF